MVHETPQHWYADLVECNRFPTDFVGRASLPAAGLPAGWTRWKRVRRLVKPAPPFTRILVILACRTTSGCRCQHPLFIGPTAIRASGYPVFVDRPFIQMHTESGPTRHFHIPIAAHLNALLRHFPPQRRLARGILQQLGGPMVRQKVEISRDLDIRLVTVRDDAFAARPRRRRDFTNSREAADHGDIRLADGSFAAIHSFDKL